MAVSDNFGSLFWGPCNKDPTYLGYYIRVSHFRKPPERPWNLQYGFAFRIKGNYG